MVSFYDKYDYYFAELYYEDNYYSWIKLTISNINYNNE